MGDKRPRRDPRLVREDELFMDASRVHAQITYTDPRGFKYQGAVVVRKNDTFILRYGGTTLMPYLLSFTSVYADTDGIITEVLTPANPFGDPPEVGSWLGNYLTGTLPEGLA